MLLEFLRDNYEENEPIFVSDIALPVTDTNLRQMFKTLCDSGQIARYDTGIYYFPGKSIIKGGVGLSASEVARYKYIARGNRVDGYYSGYTFANQLGLTTQVPFTIEIVSNQASAKCREVSVKSQKIMLRRPRTTVTRENCRILPLLDILKDLEQYTDEDMERTAARLAAYARELGIRKAQVDECLAYYPDRTYKNLYQTGLYNAFA